MFKQCAQTKLIILWRLDLCTLLGNKQMSRELCYLFINMRETNSCLLSQVLFKVIESTKLFVKATHGDY